MFKKTLLFLFIIFSVIYSQRNENNIYVDKDGILRWQNTDEEVRLFGVNYTTPFAYAYRAHKRLGLSLKQAIDLDVEQFVRLGFDAFRVHMWDREISDKEGNLLQNEHLDLFDYLIYKLSQKGIKIIITPIAWWGTAWPEPEFETPGFSSFYSKVEMVTNPDARKAQKNYLKQIINHFNPYTKLKYKDEPSIIAVEIINEPHHPDDTSLVRKYINEMYDALREENFTKPIFYNISESWSDAQAQAVCNSKVEGVSFQWYPTGLVHNKILNGNYLINVNKYKIPSENIKGFNQKAKMVYEFDAADIGSSFMYPAMARSFREAGMQFATMFAYDPSQIAWSNTEYQTHFLNLLYTPSKAISLMIASKVFHYLHKKSYGDFPQNNRFENFRISYGENLTELNSPVEFIYSNSTQSLPVSPDSLILIAGTGNSKIINYDGTGAYFLEKKETGIWRLEVYPDVLWLRDPFEQTSTKKQIAKLFWNERTIKIFLPELKENFKIIPLSSNQKSFYSFKNEFKVKPGIYLLCGNNLESNKVKKYLNRKKFLDGLYTPEFKNDLPVDVVNKTPHYILVNDYQKFLFEIASKENIEEAALYIRRLGWRRFQKFILKNTQGFNYVLNDSLKLLNAGDLEFCVTAKINNKVYTFPDGKEISPDDWDFYFDNLWKTKVLDKNTPVELFNASRDYKDLVFPQFTNSTRFFVDYNNGSTSELSTIKISVQTSGKDEFPFGFQLNLSTILNSIKSNLSNYKTIILKARTLNDDKLKMKINFITDDGKCFQSETELSKLMEEKVLSLDDFKKGSSLILPFSYPKFLPKIWNNNSQSENEKLTLDKVEFLQFIIDKNENKPDHTFEIESLIIK